MTSVYIMHFCECGKCELLEVNEENFDNCCLSEQYTFVGFVGNDVVLRDQDTSDSCCFCRKEVVKFRPEPDSINKELMVYIKENVRKLSFNDVVLLNDFAVRVRERLKQ